MPPIGKTPTWSYHGSKATISKWIIGYIPKNIRTYYEPFAGRANVYFRLVTTPEYSVTNSSLNDKFNADWYKAIFEYKGNWDFIPDIVNQDAFEKWKNSPDSIERTLIEPIVSYHSNRYNMNSAASSDIGSTFYSPNFAANWKKKYILTRDILLKNKPAISALDYPDFLGGLWELTPNDIIYLDPPYVAWYDEKRTYPNIDHTRLLSIIKTLPCKVLISNYYNELYAKNLSNWRLEIKDRVSAAKGRQLGHANGRTKVQECLWVNF